MTLHFDGRNFVFFVALFFFDRCRFFSLSLLATLFQRCKWLFFSYSPVKTLTYLYDSDEIYRIFRNTTEPTSNELRIMLPMRFQESPPNQVPFRTIFSFFKLKAWILVTIAPYIRRWFDLSSWFAFFVCFFFCMYAHLLLKLNFNLKNDLETNGKYTNCKLETVIRVKVDWVVNLHKVSSVFWVVFFSLSLSLYLGVCLFC